MLFDSHAHYDDEKFRDDLDEVIQHAVKSGVSYILNASSDPASCEKSLSLAGKYDFIYAAVGIHPHAVSSISEDTLAAVADFAKNPKVVAIGEVGLDYYYENSPREIQRHWFKRQIDLAKELNLPLVVHNREAHEDVLRIIRSGNAASVGGVFHCYSGSYEMARELIRNNFYISLGGAVTFKNARKLVEIAEKIPMDKLLIETDCPYMTPEPFRGKRNHSGYLKYVAEKIAEIRGMTPEKVASATTENAKKLFRIK